MQGLTHIQEILDKTDLLLDRHLEGYYRVRYCISPYNHEIWMNLLKDVHRTFGRPSERWQWSNELDLIQRPDHVVGDEPESLNVIFHFRKESDAVMFSLKY